MHISKTDPVADKAAIGYLLGRHVFSEDNPYRYLPAVYNALPAKDKLKIYTAFDIVHYIYEAGADGKRNVQTAYRSFLRYDEKHPVRLIHPLRVLNCHHHHYMEYMMYATILQTLNAVYRFHPNVTQLFKTHFKKNK